MVKQSVASLHGGTSSPSIFHGPNGRKPLHHLGVFHRQLNMSNTIKHKCIRKSTTHPPRSITHPKAHILSAKLFSCLIKLHTPIQAVCTCSNNFDNPTYKNTCNISYFMIFYVQLIDTSMSTIFLVLFICLHDSSFFFIVFVKK